MSKRQLDYWEDCYLQEFPKETGSMWSVSVWLGPHRPSVLVSQLAALFLEWRNFGRWNLPEGSGLLRKRLQTTPVCFLLFLFCLSVPVVRRVRSLHQAASFRHQELGQVKSLSQNKSFSTCFCEKVFCFLGHKSNEHRQIRFLVAAL